MRHTRNTLISLNAFLNRRRKGSGAIATGAISNETLFELNRNIEEPIMTKLEKVVYSGKTHTTVNRDPSVQRGDYGVVDVRLSAPGGDSHEIVAAEPHPTAEQLFAGAWSACYITALGLVAAQKKVVLPPDYSVDIQIDLGQTGPGWFFNAHFVVRMPGLAQDVAESITRAAHQLCPYSRAVHETIDLEQTIITS